VEVVEVGVITRFVKSKIQVAACEVVSIYLQAFAAFPTENDAA
jgi:hypothetical protein